MEPDRATPDPSDGQGAQRQERRSGSADEQLRADLDLLRDSPEADTFIVPLQIGQSVQALTLREVAEKFQDEPSVLHAVANHYRTHLEYESTREFLRDLPKLIDKGPAPEHETILGRGRLAWTAEERQSDRYGFLYLYKAKGHQEEVLPLDPSPSGRSGRLIAHVLESRDSTHVGDVFLKIKPVTPQVGERIVLGEGRLVVHEGLVGIKPADRREIFHCDPRNLYRAHSQTVELIFQESS